MGGGSSSGGDSTVGGGSSGSGKVGYSKTHGSFADMLAQVKADFADVPAIKAVGDFFSLQGLGSGSCDGLSTSFTVYGQDFTVDLTPVFCSSEADTVYHVMSIGLLFGAAIMAFSIAFL